MHIHLLRFLMRLRFSLLALAALLLIPSAFAQTFTTTLAGANEVPAVTTAATGSVTATLDGTTLVVTGSFSGLESDYASNIGTHLHGGSAAENGPVVVPLTVALDGDNRGGTLEAAANTYTVRETFADSIRAGLVYVNVHSQGNPSGEIRGQLRPAADLGGIVINEIDADQTGTDTAEFVELYNGGTEAVVLDDAVLVLMNGSDDASYGAFDLDGFTLEAGGYFVFCNEADNVPNCDLEADVADNLIQNGADAVALYIGSAADFPTDTPASTVNLIDVVVYGTSDDDDTDLLAALGETVQQDEDANGAKDTSPSSALPMGSKRSSLRHPRPVRPTSTPRPPRTAPTTGFASRSRTPSSPAPRSRSRPRGRGRRAWSCTTCSAVAPRRWWTERSPRPSRRSPSRPTVSRPASTCSVWRRRPAPSAGP